VDDLSDHTSNAEDNPTITPLDQNAEIAIVKTAVVGGTGSVGDEITYTFTVENTGNVTLTDVTVTDPLPNLSVISPATVASMVPGDIEIFTATYTITQDDIDNGFVENQATATGEYTDGNGDPQSVDDLSDHTSNAEDNPTITPLDQNAEIAIVKTAVVGGTGSVGDEITYTFTVENTGNVTLTDVTVTDPLPNLSVISPATVASMVPGDIEIFTATYTITQDDIDNGFVENQATATGEYTDGNGDPQSVDDLSDHTSNAEDNPTITPLDQNAEIAIVKTAVVGGTGSVGDEITYTFTVENTGNVTLTDVTVTDPLPNLSVISPATVASMVPGDIEIFTATYTITQDDIDNGFVENQATATGEYTDGNGDPQSVDDLSDHTSNAEDNPTITPLDQNAEIAIIKTLVNINGDAGLTQYTSVGDELTYEIIVTNTGNVTITDIEVEDDLTGDNWQIAILAPGVSDTLTVSYIITQADRVAGSVLNTATVLGEDPNGSPVSGDDNEEATSTRSDLSITKTVDNATPNVGDNVTFTITVTNNGPDAATGVQVTDQLPAGLTYVSSTTTQGTYDENTGLWETLTIADQGTATLTITATVEETAAGGVTNTATITASDQYDPDDTNNEDSQDVDPQQSDLAITKTVNNATPNVGDNVTFTITVTNNGPDAATGVQVTDQLPAGLTYVSSTTTQGTYDENTGLWETLTIADQGTATLTITATVEEASAGGVTNTATITASDQYDPDDTNNEDSQDIDPQQSDLAITKTVDDATPNVGDDVTFTITVTNNGPDAATGVQVTDQLPAGLTYVSSTTTQGTYDENTGLWETLTIADQGTATLEIVATVTADAFPSTTNVAFLSNSDQYDPDPTNNEDEQNITPLNADLSVQKSGSPGFVYAGEIITYTIVVQNNGPSSAENVVLEDVFPAELTILSVTPSTGIWNDPEWEIGTLLSGSSATLIVEAEVSSALSSQIAMVNTATVSSSTFDSNLNNNTDSESTSVSINSDLSITKTGAPKPATVGELYTYTLLIENLGPTDAQNVSLTDNIPSVIRNPEFSVDGSGIWNPWVGPLNLGTLESGDSIEVQIRGIINPAAVDGVVITNTAFVSSSTSDSNLSNNVSSDEVTANRESDLEIVKTQIDPEFLPAVVEVDPSTATPGEPIYYLLDVTNNGPSYAENLIIEDILPTGISNAQFSLNFGISWQAWSGTRELPQFSFPGVNHVIIRGNLDPSLSGSLLNTATVSSDTFDPDLDNNESELTTEMVPSADLVIVKEQIVAPLIEDGPIDYRITVHNQGPSTATNVEITDVIDPAIIENVEYSSTME
jgi:uncharacterized repeat protein (TIGR01451 family)